MQFFIKNKMEEFFKEKMVVIINNMVGFLKMIFQTKISKKMSSFLQTNYDRGSSTNNFKMAVLL